MIVAAEISRIYAGDAHLEEGQLKYEIETLEEVVQRFWWAKNAGARIRVGHWDYALLHQPESIVVLQFCVIENEGVTVRYVCAVPVTWRARLAVFLGVV